MDRGQHSHSDSTSHRDDEEMRIEFASALDSFGDLAEVEMIVLDNVAGPSNLDILVAEPTPTNISASPSLVDEPSFDLSDQGVSSAPPPLLRTSTRRSRVEDDHDDERDRRHPSQRVGSPSHPPTTNTSSSSLSSLQSTSTPSGVSDEPSQNPGRSPTSLNSRLNPFHFFRHILPPNHPNSSTPASSSSGPQSSPSLQNNVTASPSTAAPVPNNTPSALPTSTNPEDARRQTLGTNPRSQYLAGFSITIDVNGGMTTAPLPGTPLPTGLMTTNPLPTAGPGSNSSDPTDQTFHENPILADQQGTTTQAQTQPQPQPQPQAQSPDGAQQNPPQTDASAAFADILTRIGLLAALSFRDSGIWERDTDDPERAKKLVEGLEDVPIGLVQRLERVGKVGGSDNVMEGGLGDGGCAICWERLLVEANDQKEDEGEEQGMETTSEPSPGTENMEISSTQTESDSTLSSASQTEESQESAETGTQHQRIVTLPCAHVFHAQCLLPWFSKPRQTTCPICRFNIDPENLTYTSRAHRRAAARAQTRTQNQAGEGDDGITNDARQDVGEGDAIDAGGDSDIGIDIPLMFGGGPPIVIPLDARPNTNNAGQPPAPPAGAEPQQPQLPTGSRAEGTGASEPNNENRPAGNHIVTIGFDMYIGRGPPPFPFRGPNVIQIPIPGGAPGGLPATNDPTNNATPSFPNIAANPYPAPGTTPTDGRSNATNAANNVGGGANENVPNANDNGVGGARAPGTPFAIPIPMGAGFGRAIGDLLSRIFTTGGGGNPPQDGPAQPQPQPQQPQAQGPVAFGPERPGSLPANVGLGFGTSMLGGQGPQPGFPPFVIPFGARGPTGTNMPPRPSGGQGIPGTQPTQGGGTPQPHSIGFEAIPMFDIIGGMFGPPPQGQQPGAQAEADRQQRFGSEAHQQPTQPQPPGGNTNVPQLPGGFGFMWPPGSPPPRPASAPTPRQQTPRKKWAPPLAPGLTLRQKVEKREQEAGLRCCDMSCGVGPSDEDPWVTITRDGMKQLSIRISPPDMNITDSGVGFDQPATGKDDISKGGDQGMQKSIRRSVCPHTFHSSCLVSSERVSLALRDTQVSFVGPQENEVEVSCPICRGVGRVTKEEWDAGVEDLR